MAFWHLLGTRPFEWAAAVRESKAATVVVIAAVLALAVVVAAAAAAVGLARSVPEPLCRLLSALR